MKQYTIRHVGLVLDRIAVAWTFLCIGVVLGLFIASFVSPGFLGQRLNFLWLSLAVFVGLILVPMKIFLRSPFGKRYAARVSAMSRSA